MKETILVTGAGGQLGSELTKALIKKYGSSAVIASDINGKAKDLFDCRFAILDVLDRNSLSTLVNTYRVTQIYHLAAMLSAIAVERPFLAWNLNVQGLLNVLEISRIYNVKKVFWPSSIAVFGTGAQKEKTHQDSITNPSTTYGIAKVAGESWCSYYYHNYGLDVRSVRYPGIIGPGTPPGGGTTDYAVDIFFKAVNQEPFVCFLKSDTELPMMYMPDAIKAALMIMDADKERIRISGSYNISGMSFSPLHLRNGILGYYPEFKIYFKPDYRQAIAESWPNSIDDSYAKYDWGWQPDFTMEKMIADMFANLSKGQSQKPQKVSI